MVGILSRKTIARLPIWFIAVIVLVVLMPVAAASAAVSVSAMHSFELGGWRLNVAVCAAVAAINWLLIASFYYLTVFIGTFDALTEGVPSVPPEQRSSGVFAFFVIFINFGAILSLLTMMTSRVLGRFRYSLVVHLTIGLSSTVGAFLATKLEWWLFG